MPVHQQQGSTRAQPHEGTEGYASLRQHEEVLVRIKRCTSTRTLDAAYFVRGEQAQGVDRVHASRLHQLEARGQIPVQQPHLQSKHRVTRLTGKPAKDKVKDKGSTRVPYGCRIGATWGK
jgi:hypothetical protein